MTHMTKILYGVQGTGNGHITRARIMAAAFAQRDDVHVDYLFSGRDIDKYFDMEAFGHYQTRRGLSFSTNNGSINVLNTVRQNSLIQCWKDIRDLNVSEYDVVINDFEPITAWAAKLSSVPCINISHQAAFACPIPQASKTLIDRAILHSFAPSNIRLGVHWYHFGQHILPPFIKQHHQNSATLSEHILVYLPFESLNEIKECIEPLSEQSFIVFHPDIKHSHTINNVQYRSPGYSEFQSALHQCVGVIANGGFELSSEALVLGKKLLLKPLAGQFEQSSNIMTLQSLGLCEFMPFLSSEFIDDWLETQGNSPIHFPDQSSVLVDWILQKQWDKPQTLCDKLWQNVHFPQNVSERLTTLSR